MGVQGFQGLGVFGGGGVQGLGSSAVFGSSDASEFGLTHGGFRVSGVGFRVWGLRVWGFRV